ncbi:MAG: DNRLRE domain-containing protein [Phycisphaerales bacterium]|nr:DNRLRE domain-containing protein [Phycisphaerales bacterium]
MRLNQLSAIAATAGLAISASAGVVRIGASHDNTLYETSDGSLSNGAGQHCFVGVTGQPKARRALIAFDIQSAVPPGVQIVGVTLTMHMSKTVAGPTEVTLHRVTNHWGEGASDADDAEGSGAPAQPNDATWIHTEHDTYYWNQRGGDFDPTPSNVSIVDGVGDYSWGPWSGMIPDAQAWLDGTSANNGWILIGDESIDSTAKRFDTRENPEPANRPVLRIDYFPPCIADWDMDGLVNTRDVLAYLGEWAAASNSADLDQSGNVNTYDLLIFLNYWTSGC